MKAIRWEFSPPDAVAFGHLIGAARAIAHP
jgi:hypothetical protein